MPGCIDTQEGRSLFGADPRNYNDIRPSYPEQIYEFLLTTGALRSDITTLEIGAGNGLATRRLLDFGVNPLTVIEPDTRFTLVLKLVLDFCPIFLYDFSRLTVSQSFR